MQGIKKSISIAFLEKKSWKLELDTYVAKYNSWPHSVTGIPPAELMWGRKWRGPFPELDESGEVEWIDEELRDRDAAAKWQRNQREDKKRGAKPMNLKVGDKVLVWDINKHRKLDPHYLDEDWSVTQVMGNRVEVQNSSGEKLVRKSWAVKKKVSNIKPSLIQKTIKKNPQVDDSSAQSSVLPQNVQENKKKATLSNQVPGERTERLRVRKPVDYKLIASGKINELEEDFESLPEYRT